MTGLEYLCDSAIAALVSFMAGDLSRGADSEDPCDKLELFCTHFIFCNELISIVGRGGRRSGGMVTEIRHRLCVVSKAFLSVHEGEAGLTSEKALVQWSELRSGHMKIASAQPAVEGRCTPFVEKKHVGDYGR